MSAQAGAMGDGYPVRWAGRVAVVALPRHVGDGNAGQVRERLLWVINRGAAELIIDMTGTASCDHEGAAAVARAHQRATAGGTQLRLAVTAGAVRRVLCLNGLDRLIPVHPSLDAALAAAAPLGSGGVPDMDQVGRHLADLAADTDFFAPLIAEIPSQAPGDRRKEGRDERVR